MVKGVVVAVLAAMLLLPQLVAAQAPYPPNPQRAYRGGVNCVQVADNFGNFNCSPLVTINPLTGAFQALGGTGAFSPVFGALVIAPSGNALQALGNDIVIAKALSTTAPAGPGVGGVTLRVRPSPRIPGYCQIVAIAGTAFGTSLEFPLAFQSPSASLSIVGKGSDALFDTYVIDLPGGPGGC